MSSVKLMVHLKRKHYTRRFPWWGSKCFQWGWEYNYGANFKWKVVEMLGILLVYCYWCLTRIDFNIETDKSWQIASKNQQHINLAYDVRWLAIIYFIVGFLQQYIHTQLTWMTNTIAVIANIIIIAVVLYMYWFIHHIAMWLGHCFY